VVGQWSNKVAPSDDKGGAKDETDVRLSRQDFDRRNSACEGRALWSLSFADHNDVACSCSARANELTAIVREVETEDLFGLEVS
jgi:hypothetical protein